MIELMTETVKTHVGDVRITLYEVPSPFSFPAPLEYRAAYVVQDGHTLYSAIRVAGRDVICRGYPDIKRQLLSDMGRHLFQEVA